MISAKIGRDLVFLIVAVRITGEMHHGKIEEPASPLHRILATGR
jgi:hypothetical protein